MVTMKQYTLNLTPRQAQVLVEALELYTRVGIGHLEYVAEALHDLHPQKVDEERARNVFKDMKQIELGLHSNGHYGVGNKNVADSAHIAYDLECVVRKQLALDNPSPAGHHNVWLNDPLHYGPEPLATVEGPNGFSHHGFPELLRRDIKLLEDYTKWVTTARKSGYRDKNWIPSHPDWAKSRLFWRIRSGKEPLPYPPPTAYSCPWYEVIELPDEEHTSLEPIRIVNDGDEREVKRVAYVAQCRYELVSEGTMEDLEHASVVAYGPYRFKVWNSIKEYKGYTKGGEIVSSRLTGFIHYVETVEPQKQTLSMEYLSGDKKDYPG